MTSIRYEVTFETGISDVIAFDELESAMQYAKQLHAKTGKAIDIVKVTEELIAKVS